MNNLAKYKGLELHGCVNIFFCKIQLQYTCTCLATVWYCYKGPIKMSIGLAQYRCNLTRTTHIHHNLCDVFFENVHFGGPTIVDPCRDRS